MNLFIDSVSAKCRYGDCAVALWGNWNVVWEDAIDDYQGHARFVIEKDGTYVVYEWDYGSCSGCDCWEAEGLTDEQITAQMRADAVTYDRAGLADWAEALEKAARSSRWGLDGDDLARINAIRTHLGMPEVKA